MESVTCVVGGVNSGDLETDTVAVTGKVWDRLLGEMSATHFNSQ